ncbi:hypothetical protein ACNKHS_06965 [Shigella flexneri]
MLSLAFSSCPRPSCLSLPDALTVVAVAYYVAVGFYGIYHRAACSSRRKKITGRQPR